MNQLANKSTAITRASTGNACAQCSLLGLCLGNQFSAEAVADFSRSHGRSRMYKAGEQLFRAGDSIGGLAIVSYGSVESYRLSPSGEEQTTAWYLAGDWLPVMHNQAVLTEFITAAEETRLCVVPWSALQRLTATQPAVFERLIKSASMQLESAHAALSDINAEMRLATFLIALSGRYSRLGFDRSDVPLVMKKNRIANYLRLSPETLSRTLRRWREEGILDITTKRRLIIKDYEALLALTEHQELALAA